MLLGVLDGDLVLANTIADSHGIVGEGGEGGNEGRQDMEQSFLLWRFDEMMLTKVVLVYLQLGHGRP